jgi:hypothetical protein
MVAAANMVEVAALVGDTARARIAKSTASGHLTKLVRARLLAVTQKRRNRYYRIASPLVAKMLESIKAVAAIDVPPRYQPRSTQDDRLRFARTCYDHLAGQLGVAIADALVSKGYVVLTDADDGGEVTDSGARFLSGFGAELASNSRSRRIFCRPCLDWSERRYHVAGLVGTEIMRRCVELGWLRRDRDTRAVRVTSTGQIGLRDVFGLSLNYGGSPSRRS